MCEAFPLIDLRIIMIAIDEVNHFKADVTAKSKLYGCYSDSVASIIYRILAEFVLGFGGKVLLPETY
jgi:hypothetical protein